MKLKFNYNSRAFVLPGAVVSVTGKATKRDLQVLLRIASDQGLQSGEELDISALAEEFNCKKADIESAICFWSEAGIISEGGNTDDSEGVVKLEQHKVIKPQAAPPRYTTEEIAAVLEGRNDLPGIIDECQNAFGKVFNSHEVRAIISLLDYLGIDSDYLLVLLSYCRRIGKPSIHYVEKIAYEMYNEGIDSAKELEARLTAKELAASLESKIRKMFGIKDRALTTKEMQFIAKWASEFHYDIPVIKHAYEITVNSIKEPSLPYTNAILEKWNSLGFRTIEDITAYEAEKSARSEVKENSKVKLGNSFDTDEFFEAALRRSLDED